MTFQELDLSKKYTYEEYILQYYLENGKYVGGTHYFDEDVVVSTAVEGFKTTVSAVIAAE
jgi:hypothetical protein